MKPCALVFAASILLFQSAAMPAISAPIFETSFKSLTVNGKTTRIHSDKSDSGFYVFLNAEHKRVPSEIQRFPDGIEYEPHPDPNLHDVTMRDFEVEATVRNPGDGSLVFGEFGVQLLDDSGKSYSLGDARTAEVDGKEVEQRWAGDRKKYFVLAPGDSQDIKITGDIGFETDDVELVAQIKKDTPLTLVLVPTFAGTLDDERLASSIKFIHELGDEYNSDDYVVQKRLKQTIEAQLAILAPAKNPTDLTSTLIRNALTEVENSPEQFSQGWKASSDRGPFIDRLVSPRDRLILCLGSYLSAKMTDETKAIIESHYNSDRLEQFFLKTDDFNQGMRLALSQFSIADLKLVQSELNPTFKVIARENAKFHHAVEIYNLYASTRGREQAYAPVIRQLKATPASNPYRAYALRLAGTAEKEFAELKAKNAKARAQQRQASKPVVRRASAPKMDWEGVPSNWARDITVNQIEGDSRFLSIANRFGRGYLTLVPALATWNTGSVKIYAGRGAGKKYIASVIFSPTTISYPDWENVEATYKGRR